MSDIVSPFLQWLNANPQWAGFATFLISAAESVAIIGTIVPGSVTMAAIGTLAGAGIIPLWSTIIWGILGAIVGDGISYWLGYYFKGSLRRMWPFRTNPSILEKGEEFVNKYGVMSVFIGRFVGPVRALVPLVAGMLGMRPLLFTVSNITSAILWAPFYMLPGILLGAASLELPPDIAMHVILVLFLIFLFIVLCIWILVRLLQLIGNQTENMLIKFWQRLQKSRYFHGTTILLQHHHPKELHGQLVLAFYFLVTLFLFICLAVYVKARGAAAIFVNDAMFHLFRGIRTPSMDDMMIYLTLLGQKQIIFAFACVIAIWLLIKRCVRAGLHVFLLALLTGFSVTVIKPILQSSRPWGILNSPETFSMPSGHTTLATAIYIGIALILTRGWLPRQRKLFYMTALLIAFLVGVSRMYLGAHWFTDVLAGWLLGAAIFMFVVLSFNRQPEKPIPVFSSLLLGFVTLLIMFSYFSYTRINQIKENYTQLEWPAKIISLKKWWDFPHEFAHLRVSLFGFPSQRINIEWQGNLEDIKKTLLASGWMAPPARDWISTIHRIADVKSAEYLPMISPQFLDKKPALILAKSINGDKKLIVLRLWQSNLVFKENKQSLWVGTLGPIPRSYSWLFRKHHDINLKYVVIFPSVTAKKWQWKLVTVKFQNGNKQSTKQTILLVREIH